MNRKNKFIGPKKTFQQYAFKFVKLRKVVISLLVVVAF